MNASIANDLSFNDLSFIKDILLKSGDYIRESYVNRYTLPVNSKNHANDFLTLVDVKVQQQLVSEIKKRFPDDVILAEESGLNIYPDTVPERCWAIDPIDGTQNFLRGLFPAFGVSLALIKKGIIVAGGIYMPVQGDLFLAASGMGAVKNGVSLTVSDKNELALARVDIDFDGPVNRAEIINRSKSMLLKAGQIRSNACSIVGFCSVASGEEDVYLVLGVNTWDIAAGLILVSEAGGKTSRFDGSYVNPFDGRQDVLVSNGALHELCLKEIEL